MNNNKQECIHDAPVTGDGNAHRYQWIGDASREPDQKKISQMAWRRWVKTDNGYRIDPSGNTWRFASFNKDGNRGSRRSINVVKVASNYNLEASQDQTGGPQS